MQEISKKVRVTHRINDPSLDINQLSQYGLFLSVEDKNLRVVVVDEAQKKCMLLEDYRFSGLNTRSDTIEQLNGILESHLILRAGYWKDIILVARSGCFALIPDEFFDETLIHTYLELYPNNLDNAEVRSFFHSKRKYHSIFRIETEFIDWAKKAYPNKEIQVLHQSDAFLEGALQENHEGANIFIYIESKYMNMTILQGENLLLHNRYYYQSPQDFVYFILFAIDELQLDAETCQVKLYGEISKDSGIYNLLQKYVRNVEFGKKPSNLSFSYVFDEVIDHRYFDLYNVYHCLNA
ncbi:DUF3822 family protein [Raineya orbicola]|jgi:hypothetical protein|uniref:DUF3822 domain-containing protein n=1 Tax=Raineya orbicola TaxID=2016530 RepID=A0A2N3I7B6_9BACT|nr:DUF3822 family protein [Raineya orbicola]PKQ66201.1 hypothetical protein Rain11_2439 [Raineya orbicola]